MATVDTLMTAEEFGRLESDQLCELVRGRVVDVNMPYPRHGQVCIQIAIIVGQFVRQNQLGHLVGNDSGIVTERNPDTVRGADIAFYSYARLPKGRLPNKYLGVVPELIFEVRSPSDRWGQVMRKVSEYLEAGVKIVCVIEPEREVLHLHEADGSSRTLGIDDDFEVSTILPGFLVKVREFLDV